MKLAFDSLSAGRHGAQADSLALILIFSLVSSLSFGQIKETIAETFVPKTKKPTIINQTFFNEQGDITKIINSRMDADGDYITSTSTYTYDDQRRKLSSTILNESIKLSTTRRVSEFFYTNNTIEERSNSTGKTIKYLDANKKVYKEENIFHGNVTSLTEYKYDSAGRLIFRRREPKNDTETYSLQTYAYPDPLKRQEHTETTNSEGEKIIKDYLIELNAKGKPLKSTFLTGKTTEIFTYDDAGNEIESKTFDVNNKLVSTRKTRYVLFEKEGKK